jgi:protoporphyrinogen oxidase
MNGSKPSTDNSGGGRIAVIGAGPAGITAAYCLTKRGIPVDVYEADGTVGGMAKSVRLWGQSVDLGPHRFFSSDRRVNALWLEVVGHDYRMVNRLTRIFYRKRFFYYPLRPFNALLNLGPVEGLRCDFESWVVRRFGRRLFEVFFKTYSEKLWGIGCGELDADFAAQRIKKLNLWEALRNALLPGSNTHRTLLDQFAYPVGGTGMVYQRMAEFISRNGGRIQLSTPVRGIVLEQDRAVGIDLEHGVRRSYDHVISSMPITLLVTHLVDAPEQVHAAASRLRFRNTILVYLRINRPDLFPDNWIYIHDPMLRTGRITNFRNWVPQLYGDEESTIVVMEFWCNTGEPIWTAQDEELVRMGSRELTATGLLPSDATILAGHVIRIHRCYPVYFRGYQEALKPIEHFLSSIAGLTVIGRGGAFKYNNQDHSILMGILADENVAEGAQHDLWGVNTDVETYQEGSAITDTGLAQRA